MDRPAGLSVRLKLTLSYAGFLVLAGAVLLALWLLLVHYFPHAVIVRDARSGIGGAFAPGRSYTQRAFGEIAAVTLGFCLIFGLIGGWILAGRMLAPLSQITDATRIAARGSLSHRIAMDGAKDEFRELADSFDTMLERLEAHVAEQRRFAANASHELRTPLAITQTLLDVARKDSHTDTAALVDRLQSVNTRAINLTEALLALSRADQRSFTREVVDLSLIAEEAAETLLPLAEKHGTHVDVSGDPATTLGSRALLTQLTTNLLHNAIVHNTSGHGTVWVHSMRYSATVILRVENTGPPLAPGLVATLVEPFQRGTQRAHSDQAGVGLGLAIAKRITEAHEGTLTLAPRPGGGLCVTVRLPAAGRTAQM